MEKRILLSLVVLLAVSALAPAATRLVPGDYDTIQAAIDAAIDGDTVLVADGTYTGEGNYDIEINGKSITIRSENGPENCIIDGQKQRYNGGFYFWNNEDVNCVIDGFSIINYDEVLRGSAIHCDDNYRSILTIRNCNISNNRSYQGCYGLSAAIGMDYDDEGIYSINNCNITDNKSPGIACYSGNLTVNNCTISRNLEDKYISGGGIICWGDATINHCTISDNSSTGVIGYGYGEGGIVINHCTISGNSSSHESGGISCKSSDCTISNCTISNNSGNTSGEYFWGSSSGGIYCDDSTLTVSNCTITGNSDGGRGGGGITCDNGSSTIINCIISGNTSITSGGGISCAGSSSTISNCIISGNTSTISGGGIYCDNRFSRSYRSSTISNSTFVGNSSPNGSALACYSNYKFPSSVELTNCILWDGGDEIFNDEHSTITVGYSNVQGNWPGHGNIDIEPGFVENGFWDANGTPEDANDDFWTDGDYHLLPGTPCIDAGKPFYIAGPNEKDIDGNPRLFDGDNDNIAVIDMGAYEWRPDGPIIAVEPTNVTFVYQLDSPGIITQILSIWNDGDEIINWQITEDCPWLQAAPVYGQSSGEVNEVVLTVDADGLDSGVYNCVLTVFDKNIPDRTLHVPVNLFVGTNFLRIPGQYPTIQGAIDAAADGATVLVADGIYTGDGNRDIDFRGKAVTLTSENGPGNCLIDCQGSTDEQHRGFYFHSDEDANSVINGLAITNSYFLEGRGAIYCYGSSPTITNCTISGNWTEWGGSAISCWGSNATISGCTISDNWVEEEKWDRAAIFCVQSNATITGCTIRNNMCSGIHTWKSSPTIKNCIVTGNSTEGVGGGIYCYEGSSTISNCTITGNSASSGGGIYNYNAFPTLTNCILWDNWPEQISIVWVYWPEQISVGTASVTYSNVQGGWQGEGNIDADPCFAQPGLWNPNGTPDDANDDFWVDGDYHLLPDSLCIDAGDPCYIPEPNETDLDGSPRIINGRIDMGAYESDYLQARLWLFPQTINRQSRLEKVMAWMKLPEGITKDQIDQDTPLLLYPGHLEPINQYIFEYGKKGDKRVNIFAFYDKAEFMAAVPDNGQVQLEVIGNLTTSQEFYGSGFLTILDRQQPRKH